MAPTYLLPRQIRANGGEKLPQRRNPPGGEFNPETNTFMTWRNRLTALVVDSESFCRMLEKSFLSAYGVETEDVESGSAAFELIQGGATFDLIVINPHLCGISGIETARLLRNMGVQSRIVGSSAMYVEEERSCFLRAGGDHYVEKPFGPHLFIPILQQLDNQ
ncbi:hypothetical protein G4B88_024575 [Cannabis sativa]|uniref:Response regulatory domain-containing protein n=1 Tax=Cannabis sativa TaxID=3483 RepID=A0A7J6GVR4_CANSA|nr:hypothetical protein G4B88_024575 [Cannabis sativa]